MTIVWCDTYSNATRWLSSQSLREFESRVAFHMNATDSSNLIDSPAASRLGPNRAIVYLADQGLQERFRPYGPPALQWLEHFGELPDEEDDSDPEICEDIDLWTVT